MALPENIDASYLDESPGDAAHQQHHDEIHGKVNRIPAGTDAVVTETSGNATFVAKAGDTMTGALTLPGAPTVDLHAATKAYVDANAGSDVPVLITASQLGAVVGAPTLSYVGSGSDARKVAWLMDPATYEDVSGSLYIPTGWATVHVDLYWTNPNASVGDVVWRLHHDIYGDMDGTNSNISNVDTTVAAPGQFVAKVTRLVTSLTVTAGKVLTLQPQRRGGDAPDTLANDAALLAVLITKAS